MAAPAPLARSRIPPATQARNNMARCKRSIDVSKYIQFFRFSSNVYFIGNGKVSFILVTISNWVPTKKIKKQKLCRGFL